MSLSLQLEAEARYPVVTVNGRDLLAWAKRIVWRHEHQDRDLLHIQIQFAYEALGRDMPKSSA